MRQCMLCCALCDQSEVRDQVFFWRAFDVWLHLSRTNDRERRQNQLPLYVCRCHAWEKRYGVAFPLPPPGRRRQSPPHEARDSAAHFTRFARPVRCAASWLEL